ncbi:hypothetical protein DKT69_34895 [Micromonospora sicca]|uniref:Treble clef zinc finger domain-containing protein n=2 Tax=Micromonospora sicca TaxID=2202420 RepID=A0A317D0L6_9ACTN|nr:hypothetical protein DKT69_34895 [Micromonospora sp. 4G51]
MRWSSRKAIVPGDEPVLYPHPGDARQLNAVPARQPGMVQTVAVVRPDADRRQRRSLADTHPEVGMFWDIEANLPATPLTVTAKSHLLAWWFCSAGHAFQAKVGAVACTDGTISTRACDECRAEDEAETAALVTVRIDSLPELVAAWCDDEPIGDLLLGDHAMRKLHCPNGHRPRVSPFRYYTSGCPHCSVVRAPTVAEAHPELAAQWHPTRNRRTADDIGEFSVRKIWWLSPCCGCEWQASPQQRLTEPRHRCPVCESILDSLGERDPDLARQWHRANALTPFHVKPYSSHVVRWVCPADASHEWEASVGTRSAGTGCPHCSTAGTSIPETMLVEALRAHWTQTRQGATVPRTVNGPAWRVDALVSAGGRHLVVEYDGQYWHADKTTLDEMKTLDLLASGHHVVRIRENDLPDLPIRHDRLLQLRHRPRFDAVAPLGARIAQWWDS